MPIYCTCNWTPQSCVIYQESVPGRFYEKSISARDEPRWSEPQSKSISWSSTENVSSTNLKEQIRSEKVAVDHREVKRSRKPPAGCNSSSAEVTNAKLCMLKLHNDDTS